MSSASIFIPDWMHYLEKFSELNKDIYFTRLYHELHASGDRAPECFVYKEGKNIFLLPYLLTPIPDYADFYDIESAYGLGGPLSNSQSEVFIQRACSAFLACSQQKNIVAGFIRCHPLVNNHLLLPPQCLVKERDTVFLDLTSDYRSSFNKRYRYEIRRAEREGVEVVFDHGLQRLGEFVEMYEETMRRLDASSFYYFPADYYSRIRNHLKDSAMLVFAEFDNRVISAGLFFHYQQYSHYHLSARISSSDYDHLSTPKLVVAKAAETLQAQGARILQLGGGTSNSIEDNLLRFKLGFSLKTAPFYTARVVFAAEAYKIITEEWCEKFPEKIDRYGNYFLKYRY